MLGLASSVLDIDRRKLALMKCGGSLGERNLSG